MKNFLKHFSGKNNLLLAAIFIIAVGIRFYDFPNRVTFWSEQARSLVVSANYIKEKPSLLGQEYFIRQDSNAHALYAGAYFNYSLVPLLLFSNYDPIVITAFFAVLNLITGLVIYWVARKIFNKSVATVSAFLFLFNDWMIYHSLFIWSYSLLPLIGILTLYYSWLHFKEKKIVQMFILGLLGGIGISLQFLYIPFALTTFAINILKSKTKVFSLIAFLFGVILGNLPMVIFDLRHDFYLTKTLIQYFSDTLAGNSNATFAYYYLLPLWPVAAILGGWIVSRLNKILVAILVVLYLLVNLTSSRVSWTRPTGMPEGLTVRDIDMASGMIAKDAEGKFNVSEVLDFDKRGYIFRYFVEFKYGKKPMGETEYEHLDRLYVLAGKDYNFDKSDVWEVSAGGPYKARVLGSIGTGHALYKLEK